MIVIRFLPLRAYELTEVNTPSVDAYPIILSASISLSTGLSKHVEFVVNSPIERDRNVSSILCKGPAPDSRGFPTPDLGELFN